ncbi:hypothetical protein HKT28_30060 [Pseudomonas aeruginosa]|nr:hypothetical protein [Pseudomonas aeruginosa]
MAEHRVGTLADLVVQLARQLLRQALDELRANGAEAELDGERIFQRMGMERTLGEYLSRQRLHPLGEANFTLAREFVQ